MVEGAALSADSCLKMPHRSTCYNFSMDKAAYTIFETPIGRCAVAWSAHGLRALQLPERDDGRTRARLLALCPDASELTPPDNVRGWMS